MEKRVEKILNEYVDVVKNIYKEHIQQIILYGSYARGDYRDDSDIDIMILLDIPDMKIKDYRHTLSNYTYDFNIDNDVDIKPIAKNEAHFNKWAVNYPFYNNIRNEGIRLYGTK
ncbi:nucleotidyltransferase domain-containing protein [bacterium]|nr:nucleotidyltransferase domain-containing protein [bacterium]MBR5901893.1 nucleotidyltransferase domain-containing protein [bacterium]